MQQERREHLQVVEQETALTLALSHLFPSEQRKEVECKDGEVYCWLQYI